MPTARVEGLRLGLPASLTTVGQCGLNLNLGHRMIHHIGFQHICASRILYICGLTVPEPILYILVQSINRVEA